MNTLKQRYVLLVLALLVVIAATPLRAAPPHISRESIEWCNIWIADVNDSSLPRVLLIGDSITQGYGPKVAEALKGRATVARLTTSKSLGDPVLLAEVALVLGQCAFDVVHVNNGLHGWGYSEDEYRRSFPELLATIRKHAPRAKIIWAMTTPVRTTPDLKEFSERTERVIARNKIAAEITAQEQIPVDDLFSLVKDHPEYWRGDGVHFNEKGVAAEAQQVADSIRNCLK